MLDRESTPESESTTDHDFIIAALSEKLGVPHHRVREVYWQQHKLLSSTARIRDFVDVLASGNTRVILREESGRAREENGQTHAE